MICQRVQFLRESVVISVIWVIKMKTQLFDIRQTIASVTNRSEKEISNRTFFNLNKNFFYPAGSVEVYLNKCTPVFLVTLMWLELNNRDNI